VSSWQHCESSFRTAPQLLDIHGVDPDGSHVLWFAISPKDTDGRKKLHVRFLHEVILDRNQGVRVLARNADDSINHAAAGRRAFNQRRRLPIPYIVLVLDDEV